MSQPPSSQRLDKWLWAARFYKTRALANDAIDNGKVDVNGQRAKPSKEVKVGDRIDIRLEQARWEIEVCALNLQRRPAPEARQLYCESEESRQRREAAQLQQRLSPTPGSDLAGRPTKRDRRRIDRFRG